MAEWITREGSKTRIPDISERTASQSVMSGRSSAHSKACRAAGVDRRAHRRERGCRSPGVGPRCEGAKAVSLSHASRGARAAPQVPTESARDGEGASPFSESGFERTPRRRRRSQRATAAAVVRLISESFFRVGSERYAIENKTFGITTLRKRHVQIADGRVVFNYVGKKSIKHRQVVANRELTRLVKRHMDTPGTRLFRYQDGRKWRDLTARDVNAYLHETLGVPYSAKDFRTWGGDSTCCDRARRTGIGRLAHRGEAQRGHGDAARRIGIG